MSEKTDGRGQAVPEVAAMKRREFLAGSTPLGISAALGTSMVARQARAELDNGRRVEMYAEMQQIVRDEGGTIVPFFCNFLIARRTNVRHGKAIAGNWQMDGYKAAERWWFA